MIAPETIRHASSSVEMGPIEISARARTRLDFSIVHMLAAARSSRHTKIAEDSGNIDETLQDCTTCVISTVAALEAYANELFFDLPSTFPGHKSEFLTAIWSFFESKGVLEKFEFALLLRNNSAIEKGQSPYQDVAALIKLRNAVVHFKSEWEDEQTTHKKVTAAIQGKYLLPDNAHPGFTSRWACHACTEWAVTCALDFVKEFEQRSNLPDVYGPFSSSLAV